MYLGERKIDSTLVFCVNTHTPSTGAEVDADAAPTYRIYEDETATPVATGTMALLDDANTTGFYSESITLSAATYDAGKSYTIRINGVVSTVAGNELHYFTVAARATDDLAFPTTSGRSIDVDAAGGVEVDSLQTGAITADSIATDAGTEIRDAVWANSVGNRTLTSASAATTAAATGDDLVITAYTSWSQTISGLTIPADWLWVRVTIKMDVNQTDDQALVVLLESNPHVGTDGLQVLNGATGSAAQGSITVNQASGTVTPALTATSTSALAAAPTLVYDVKSLSGTVTITDLTKGAAEVELAVTRTIV